MTTALAPSQDADFIGRVLDEGEVEVDGVTVLTRPRRRHQTYEQAIESLVRNIAAGENYKVLAARDLQDIRDLELYRQIGYESFAEALPHIVAYTDRVGWKSSTSVKRYLAWADLYLDTLQIPEKVAIGAVSHYHILYRLADVDRKTGELRDEPRKDGKLGAVEFEDIARLVGFLVNEPTRRQMETGLTSEETISLLVKAGLGKAAETYAKIMGRVISLPAGGWGVSHTQEIVDKVTGRADTEEQGKVTRVWVGSKMTGRVVIDSLEFRRDGEVIDRIEIGKEYDEETFALIRNGDKAEIDGEDD